MSDSHAPAPAAKPGGPNPKLFPFSVAMVQMVANSIGAGLCIFYFNFFDSPQFTPDLDRQALVGGVMSLGLMMLGFVGSTRFYRDLSDSYARLIGGEELPPGHLARVQRKALNSPAFSSGMTFLFWIWAALLMGLYSAFLGDAAKDPAVALLEAARIFLGVFISGVVTTSIVFFFMDRFFRKRLPVFFPAGGIREVAGTFRLSVRRRLLAAFLLVGAGPLLVLGALFYSKLVAALGPAAHHQFAGLLYAVVFVPAVMLGASLVLTHLVSNSIAEPLAELDKAMGRVARGDLSGHVPVRSNDELGSLAERFNKMVEGLKERERIKETFGRFVSKEIAGRLLEHKPTLGGTTTVVTILFSDIRNYTTICEQLNPSQVIEMLNGYFSYMVEAVENCQGLVYQFVGDGIMAVFGAPARMEDHATAGVDCALAMHDALTRFNQERGAGFPPLEIGVGVNTGSVVAGIIGAEQRMEYRVVGDAVNLTSRIEALNKELGTTILISRTTKDLLTKPYKLTSFEPRLVKGKTQIVQVYGVEVR